MKTTTLLAVAAVILTGFGCRGPKLAERGLSMQQREWAEALRQWHPQWEPPHRSPTRGSAVRRRAPVSVSDALRDPDDFSAEEDAMLFPEVPPISETVSADRELEPVIVPPEEDVAEEAPVPQSYTARKGDTLTHISVRFYGTPGQWRKILEANRDKLRTARDLRPGMELTIPR